MDTHITAMDITAMDTTTITMETTIAMGMEYIMVVPDKMVREITLTGNRHRQLIIIHVF